MKKISQILEAKNTDNLYRVKVELVMEITAANEGEVAYLVEDKLKSLEVTEDMVISNIEKINNFEKKVK